MPATMHVFVPGPANIREVLDPAMDIRMKDMRAPELPRPTVKSQAD
jgi:hypothetical protein